MGLALGIDYLTWSHLLQKHKISLLGSDFSLRVSLAYYSLLFSAFFLIYMIPYIRYLAYTLFVLHLAIFISDNVHFFQYAAYISGEGIRLFFQSKGEVTHLLKTGLGPVQLLYILKLFLATVSWALPLGLVLSTAKKFFPDLQKRQTAHLGGIFIFCLLVFTVFHISISGKITEKTIRAIRISGSMASHLYLAAGGYLKPREIAKSEGKFVKPESRIDPTNVPKNQSNIILVLMDSIRADHMPDYGYHRNTTPFISSMADDLIRIKYCYAQANATEKSFPSILLSKYPYFYRRNKNWGFLDYFAEQGYSAAISSSMDLHWAYIIRMFRHKIVKQVFHAGDMPKKYHIWGFTLSSQYNYGVDDGYNVAQVRKWIHTLPQPFFLVVHLHSAHYSYEVPKKYEIFHPVPKLPFRAAPPWKPMLNAYDNAIYRVDDAVRELFDVFRENELLDNSTIAITSDHGESFDEHPGSFYHQTSLYESQVRVPLYFYVGKKLARSRYLVYQGKNRITGLVDVMPTLVKSAGLPLPEQYEGVPIWGHSSKNFETMISFLIKKEYAVRMDRWKFIKNINIRTRQLFDIEKDPVEKKNIYRKHLDLVRQLEKMEKPIH